MIIAKTQVRKVGKKIKDETYTSVPQYADWEQAEVEANDHCMMNIKTLSGMEALAYDFGHDYKQARQIIDLQSPIFLLDTDKGRVRVEVQRLAIQHKTWWQRHFSGARNGQVVVAYCLKGTLGKEGKWYELYKWNTVNDIENVADYVETMAYELRCFAETVYNYDFEKVGAPAHEV